MKLTKKSSTTYTENTVTFTCRILSKLDLNGRGDCVKVEFNLKPLGKNLHFTLRSDPLLSLSLLWDDPHARVIPSSAFYNLFGSPDHNINVFPDEFRACWFGSHHYSYFHYFDVTAPVSAAAVTLGQ